jgi:hypothetical protein
LPFFAAFSFEFHKPNDKMRRISLTTLFNLNPPTDENHHFETSWLLPPFLLASLRALISLYIFTTIFFFWGWNGTQPRPRKMLHSR